MKKEKLTVWVVTGLSESGDEYGPQVYTSKPSEELLKELAENWDSNSDGDGPGDFGTYVWLDTYECEVIEQ